MCSAAKCCAVRATQSKLTFEADPLAVLFTTIVFSNTTSFILYFIVNTLISTGAPAVRAVFEAIQLPVAIICSVEGLALIITITLGPVRSAVGTPTSATAMTSGGNLGNVPTAGASLITTNGIVPTAGAPPITTNGVVPTAGASLITTKGSVPTGTPLITTTTTITIFTLLYTLPTVYLRSMGYGTSNFARPRRPHNRTHPPQPRPRCRA